MKTIASIAPVYLIGLGLACLSLAPLNADATTRTVTSLADNGAGTLRDTIAASAANDTILFSVSGTITLTSGELLLGRNLTIRGPAAGVTVDGNNSTDVFHILAGTVIIENLTVTDGNPSSSPGGGIYNQGVLTVNNCTISHNSCFEGGGIYSEAPLTVNNCTFCNNTVRDQGGGIFTMGNLTVNNCTFSSNYAGAGGGGIRVNGDGATIVILNSIIAKNNSQNPGPDVQGGPITSNGHNLIGVTNASSGWIAGDLTGSAATPLNPLLGPLQDNGGPTFTMALLSGSAAIDAGNDAVISAPFYLTTDQRGRPRKAGAHVDIGAVEIGSPITLVVSNLNDSGAGSLRQAISNVSPIDPDNITFASGLTGAITLTSGELLLNKNLSIIGPGATNLAISGGSASRVFDVTNVTVNISGLAIRDGIVNGGTGSAGQRGRDNQGAGILNYGQLVLSGCQIFNNTATGGSGGSSSTANGGAGGSGEGAGIANFNQLSLSNCYVHDNVATGGHGGNGGTHLPGTGGSAFGGGIYNLSNLLIVATAISSNTAGYGTHGSGSGGEGSSGSAFGGGVASVSGSVSNIISTIADNTANGYGGGIYCNAAFFSAIGCTIAGNAANFDGNGSGGIGGGIDGLASGGNLGGSIVATNTAGASSPDVAGTFSTGGYNLIGVRDGSTGFVNGTSHDLVGTQASPLAPLLGLLADNGGTTPTMALLAGSPAIDQGRNFGLIADQRGRVRPYDYAGIVNASGGDGSDIGAFELTQPILNIARTGNNVLLTWSAGDTGYTLQAKTNLSPSTIWATVAPLPVVVSGQYIVTNSLTGPQRFYRLIQ